jgi:hypothetical protein
MSFPRKSLTRDAFRRAFEAPPRKLAVDLSNQGRQPLRARADFRKRAIRPAGRLLSRPLSVRPSMMAGAIVIAIANAHFSCPEPSPPGRCAWCGQAEAPGVVVPFGIQLVTWLHAECWLVWFQARRAQAMAAVRRERRHRRGQIIKR